MDDRGLTRDEIIVRDRVMCGLLLMFATQPDRQEFVDEVLGYIRDCEEKAEKYRQELFWETAGRDALRRVRAQERAEQKEKERKREERKRGDAFIQALLRAGREEEGAHAK